MMLLDIHEPGQTPLTHEGTASVGIDLGTTNSLVAISNGGLQEVVGEDGVDTLIPSVVAYGEDGSIKVGREAEQATNAIRSIKRLMGRGAEDTRKIGGMYLHDVSGSDEGMLSLNVNGKSISPVEVSSEILKAIKHRAEMALENKVDRAVITVPAYFDDAARTATKYAAKLAGLEVLRLVNEPTAAALAYGLDKNVEGIYAVYDLGGGTFDMSLLKMEKGVFQVIATGGDSILGGDDFDHEIAEYFIAKYVGKRELNPKDVQAILKTAREAKEYLTENEKGLWNIAIGEDKVEVELDAKTLNKLIEPYVKRTVAICNSTLDDSGVTKDNIKGIILVGGSTRIPLIKKEVEKILGQKPLDDIDPDKVVAIGAAIQAEALTQGSENLLLDVTPLSLGIETMGGIVENIIPRNTPIPAFYSQKFTTYQNGQTGMKIHVLQGEREMVDQCRSLAEFELTGIPPMTAGLAVVEVSFVIDADGLLTVKAKEQTTGEEQEIAVKPSYGLPPEKIEKMLEESMKNAKDDIIRKLLAQSRVDADVLINTVKNSLRDDGELIDKEVSQAIESQLSILQKEMKKDDRDTIDY